MIEVYCDESRPEVVSGNSKDPYMVIGSVWTPYLLRESLKNKIKSLQVTHYLFTEFKWNRISPAKLSFYKDLVDLFFDEDYLRYRCIVIDGNRLDVDFFHESDGELGFYKFYYQLLYHWVDPREQYWFYLDYKKNRVASRLETLHRILSYKTPSICGVQAINSKESILIQLADVLTGAVGYKYNNYSTSDAKCEIIDLIERRLGSYISRTSKSENKFNVFQINLRG